MGSRGPRCSVYVQRGSLGGLVMRYKFFFVAALLAVAAAAFSGGKAAAGSVKGGVRDMGKTPPSNGLSGAKVWLRLPSGKQSAPVITDTDGQYHIIDVANGQYTLVVAKVGYIPSPHDRTKVKVEGDIKAGDVLLMQAYANNAYYSAIVTSIVKKVGAAPTGVREEVFTNEWENLRAINLPPSS